MDKELFITAEEVASELRVSQSYAYKVVREMNKQLKQKGFLVISGKVNRQYFEERIYGGTSIDIREVS